MNRDSERRYNDEEVAEVLQRAVQPVSGGRNLTARRPSEGITLAQLESVAAEAGIDPDRVRHAALALRDAPPPEGGSLVFGPRTTHVFDLTIEGEVPPGRLSDLVAAIRRLTRVKGKIVEVGDWIEWTSDAKTIHMTVKPENGRTHLQLMGDAGPKLIGIWGPVALATLISLVAVGQAGGLGLGLAGAIVGGAYALARGAWEIVGRRAGAKYGRLADRLATEAERLVPPPDTGPGDRRRADASEVTDELS